MRQTYEMKTLNRLVLLVSISLMAICGGVFAESTNDPASMFREKLAQYRQMKGDEWRKLADFSFESKLYKFAERDEAKAKFYGKPCPTPRTIPDAPLPPDAMAKYKQWGQMRKEMIERVRAAGIELVNWAKDKYSPGLSTAAKELLDELPDEPVGHKATGRIYSPELGWVTGEEAVNVQKGLLPFGKGWMPRDEVIRIRSDWATAWEITTTHFKVRTNTSPELAWELVRFLDALREAWLSEFSGFKPPRSTGKLSINLFKSYEDYATVCKMLLNGQVIPGAFYTDMTGHTYITAGSGPDGYLFSPWLIAHEHSHQFLHQFMNAPCMRYYDRPGAWINEALASYCETVIIVADRVAFAGYRDNHHFRQSMSLAKEAGLKPLAEFVNLDGRQYGPDSRFAYFQGMALTSYLLHSNDGKYRKAYYKYIQDVVMGKGTKTRFEGCFGIKPDVMEQDFLGFLLSSK